MPKNNRSAAGQRRIMQAIRSKDTKPELRVRRLLHRLGYRFRVHLKDLPGKPDIVFTARRKVIFVHGCFWHGHDDPACPDSRRPQSNTGYWNPKLDQNMARDRANLKALENTGWNVLVLWACQIANDAQLEDHLVTFLGSTEPSYWNVFGKIVYTCEGHEIDQWYM
jgi:DNA mismatch endonuclease (patch repair protein)